MEKFCSSCGNELLNPDAISCPACGGAIKRNYRDTKDPGIAAVLSFLFVGLGQIYNGQIGKGILYMVIAFLCFLSIFLLIGFLLLPLWWIVNTIDARATATKINRSEPFHNFINFD